MPRRMASGIARVPVDAYHRELEASDQHGREVVLEPGLKYYGTLAQRGLAALAAVEQSPKIDELNTKIENLLALSADEHEPFELYDLVASNGADLEAAVTGKALTDILPERAPVNPPTAARRLFDAWLQHGPRFGSAVSQPGGRRVTRDRRSRDRRATQVNRILLVGKRLQLRRREINRQGR